MSQDVIHGQGLDAQGGRQWVLRPSRFPISSEVSGKDASVKLVYLPVYSPDLNPIEHFFSELNAFIRREFRNYTRHCFRDFLKWCIDIVGALEESARGHFQHAGLVIEEP
jgi:hypothetical protein